MHTRAMSTKIRFCRLPKISSTRACKTPATSTSIVSFKAYIVFMR
jgi:hypothetical protein